MKRQLRRPACARPSRANFLLAGALVLSPALPVKAAQMRSEPARTAELRLLTPLSSTASPVGSSFQAVFIAPFEPEGEILIPAGSIVHGTVTKRTRVGLGLIHERAGLTLRFDDYRLPDGRRFPLTARLRAIENARESVTPDGRVRGILAADSPQSVLGGVWLRPTMASFPRAFIGLSGVAGSLATHLAWGPIGALGLVTAHCVMFHMPEPEIQLPPGAEFELDITSIPSDAPRFGPAERADLPPDLVRALAAQPDTLSKPGGRPVRDIINLAFAGSREDLDAAFQASGWIEAQPITARSISRVFGAFTAQKGYSDAPVSLLLYKGFQPDLTFEKSFNDVRKRDHVRIWKTQFAGKDIWLGAATRDKGMGFNPFSFSFTHRIQSNIDLERQKIINDLVYSGYANPVGFVERPQSAASSLTETFTDGRLAVLDLRPCPSDCKLDSVGPTNPTGNLVKRVARRLILEGRQYAERESAPYWLYRIGKWSYTGLRKPLENWRAAENARLRVETKTVASAAVAQRPPTTSITAVSGAAHALAP